MAKLLHFFRASWKSHVEKEPEIPYSIVKLFELTVLAIALSLSGCAEGKVTSARFVDASSGVQIDYILTGAHVVLAAYERTLHIRFGHREEDFPLEMDSGGSLIQSIYRFADQKFLLFDGDDYVVVDALRETVERVASLPADAPQYLGCFDWPPGDVLRFIPATERAEKRPIKRPGL
jgi:hypothetical protein